MQGWVNIIKKDKNVSSLVVSLTFCCRMKVFTIIIFCSLILGISSQTKPTFLGGFIEGKDERMGWGEAAPRFHLSRGHIPSRKNYKWVEREHCFQGRSSPGFSGQFCTLLLSSPGPRPHKVWAPTFSRSEEEIWSSEVHVPYVQVWFYCPLMGLQGQLISLR